MGLTSPAYVISASSHSAQLFRQTLQALTSGTGVVGVEDLKVTTQSGLKLGIAAGTLLIPGTQGSSLERTNFSSQHGTYSALPTDFNTAGVYAALNSSVETVEISTPNPTNARIDLIVVQVKDAQYSGSENSCIPTVVKGTAAGSPSPPTPPENCVVLAQIEVPAGATEIKGSNVKDERPRASVGGLSWGFGNPSAPGGASVVGSNDYAAAKIATGEWEIAWTVERITSGFYTVVATPVSSTASYATIPSQTASAFKVATYEASTDTKANMDFGFIAVSVG